MMMKIRRTALALTIGLGVFSCRPTFTHAADGTWTATGNGAWNNTGVWAGGIIAGGTDFTAFLNANVATQNRNYNLGENRTIGNITLDNANTPLNVTLINNTLTLDVTSGAPNINVAQANRTLTINSVIAGNDGLTKTGPGTLTLSGNKTYSGTTTISEGTLRMAANVIPSSANIIVGSGATLNSTGSFSLTASQTLGGTGTFSGNLSGLGTVAPGNSIGALNIIGDYGVTGTHLMEISKSAGPVLSADLLNITGNLTYAGNLQVSIPGPELATLTAGDTWNLFDSTIAATGTFANGAVFGTAGDGTYLPTLDGGLTWSFDYGSGELSVVAIPEPSTLVLGGFALLGFAGVRLRRRNK